MRVHRREGRAAAGLRRRARTAEGRVGGQPDDRWVVGPEPRRHPGRRQVGGERREGELALARRRQGEGLPEAARAVELPGPPPRGLGGVARRLLRRQAAASKRDDQARARGHCAC